MEKKGILDFSIEELKIIIEASERAKDLEEFKRFLITIQEEKTKVREEDLNTKLDLNMFRSLNIFTPYEIEILEANSINNLRDLLETDLSQISNVPNDILRHFDWARNIYNTENYQKEFLVKKGDSNGKGK